MASSRIITLFAATPPPRTRPSSFLVSALTHGLMLGIAALTLMNNPRVDDQPPTHRYISRIVKLRGLEPQLHWSPGSSSAHSAPGTEMHAARSGERMAAAAAPKLLAYKISAPITLVQPDIKVPALLPVKTPVPLLVMWTPQSMPVEKIVPPPPQPNPAVHVRPSLAMPNHEANVSDVEISSTAYIPQAIPVTAGTTSPISLPGRVLPSVPATVSSPSAQPVSATVMSVSDVLLTKGTVTLPPVNQTAAATASEVFAPGRPESTSKTGSGTATGKQDENGSDANTGSQGNQNADAAGSAEESSRTAGPGSGLNSASDLGSGAGLPAGSGESLVRIARPKNGSFGFVVVGDSIADEYPEAAAIWADRLAYTVYLHVGSTKSWTMQYCLPRMQQASANIAAPAAPWPYLIVVPHLGAGDSDADALLVHGFINATGHFEHLAVVFPAQFQQAKFVLGALQQWQFRPAAQNGRSTAVEVLLMIPEEAD